MDTLSFAFPRSLYGFSFSNFPPQRLSFTFLCMNFPSSCEISDEIFSHSGLCQKLPCSLGLVGFFFFLICYTLILSLLQNMTAQQKAVTQNTEFLLFNSVSVREQCVIIGIRSQSCPAGLS